MKNFNQSFGYKPSEKFFRIREKIIRWKKFISYYENDSCKIEEIRKNALKAAKSIKNNTPGNIFKISQSNLEWVRECNSDSKVNILYIHGGGFIAGSLDNHRPFAKVLSGELNAGILMIDYPLAPENKYPVQLDEVKKSFIFMKENSPKNSVNGILGDSAGANIGLSAILNLSENEKTKPDFGVFLSGFFDLALQGRSIKEKADLDFVLKPEFLKFCADCYAGEDNSLKNPQISPLYGDFSSCCSLFFQVGTSEILMDDSLRCHRAALEKGVSSTLSLWPEMMHSFQSYYPYFPESIFAVREIGHFIKDSIPKPG